MPNVAYGLAVLFIAQVGQAMATAAGPATLLMLAPGQIRAQATAIYYMVIGLIAQFLGPPLVGLITVQFGNPAALRYAIALEAAIVGLPSLLLTLKGFSAYRRSITQLDKEIAQLQPT
jgi:MFS family permease